MTDRDAKADPRWWDQTDEGYQLRYAHGVPGVFDLIDLHVAAGLGDLDARANVADPEGNNTLAALRELLDENRQQLSKYRSQ